MDNEKKNKKIKVIKKTNIGVAKTPKVEKKTPKETTTRNIVSTISKWVDDLKKSQIKDTKTAVDRFNKNRPQNA